MNSAFLVSSRYTRMYDVRLAVALKSSTAAALLQQLHYHLEWRDREGFDKVEGRTWWRSSMSEWRKEFPDVSESTIRREIKELIGAGIIDYRRETNSQGVQSVWYAIDYARVDEVGKMGDLTKHAPCQDDTPPLSQIDSDPPVNLQKPPCQTDSHLIYPSENTTSERSPSPSADATGRGGRNRKSLEQLQEDSKTKSLLKIRERFARTESVHSVERLWEILVVEHFGRKGYIPWSVVDRQNTKKHFIVWCNSAEVKLPDFLEYCIANWEALRDHRLKALKLGEFPSYRTIYSLKDRFLEQMRKSNGHGKTTRPEVTISRVDQLPKDHPNFAALKKVLERGGVVTLS